jgi:hypothetical protein
MIPLQIEYIKDVHGFEDENITILMDDGEHTEPTYENIVDAFSTLVSESECTWCEMACRVEGLTL